MIAVRFFAAAHEAVGVPAVQIAFSGSVADLRIVLANQWPALATLLPRCAMAVNRNYADNDDPIIAGDEVAVLPPVSGG